MSKEFVAEYIQACLLKGVQSIPDIRQEAEDEISKINEEISKIEDLKTRQGKLRAVIKHLGGGVSKKREVAKTMDFSMKWDNLDSGFQELCLDICRLVVENHNLTPREIMNTVSDPREHTVMYSAIKWLDYNNVIGREMTDDGRLIVKGSAWEKFFGDKNESMRPESDGQENSSEDVPSTPEDSSSGCS